MRTRRLLLIASSTLGLLMNDLSAAQSRAVTEVPHSGMSPDALERAYIDSYKQSGFRLASREKQSLPVGSWMSVLVFELKSSPEGPGAPGTALALAGDHAHVGYLDNGYEYGG
jgi:hypothetical protein